MDTVTIKVLAYALKEYYEHADQTEQVILTCAGVAAAADAVGSVFPGIAIPATIIGCTGAVWAMYVKLCRTLELRLNERTLKLLARAAIANIGANLGGALLTLGAAMFIPGASVAASAVISFITVYLAGHIFLAMVLKMARKSADPHTFSDINEAELRSAVRETAVSKDDLAAAKDAFDRRDKE